MVLFKRKHVQYQQAIDTTELKPTTDVWVIEQTGEFFTEYEEYLKRRDFYYQKQFTCEISGHSGLTFFDALDSEQQESREVDSTFPEPLRGPVLKKVQFATVPRIENLVNWVYEEFKKNFFPKERVVATIEADDKVEGVVRDKVTFPARTRPDGSIERPEWSQYFLILDSDDKGAVKATEGSFDAANLSRDRRVFSKQILKSFLKNSLTKDAWHGAPWRVKDSLAVHYRIPSVVPLHLQYDSRAAERRALAAAKKTTDAENKATFFDFLANKNKINMPTKNGEMRNGVKSKLKSKGVRPPTHEFQVNHQAPNTDPGQQGMPQIMRLPMPQGMSPQQSPFSPIFVNGQLAYPVMPSFQPSKIPTPPPPMPPPPPPQIKYPTEDLDVPPRKDQARRPKLQFFAQELPKDVGDVTEPPTNGIKMKSMGPLLDIWNTLNVQCEVFIIDSFTFDDFAEAMSYTSDEVECELLNETFCATLKQIVDDKGNINVNLPEFEEEDSDEDEEEDDDESVEAEPEPEPERRTTRSSFAKAAEIKPKSPTPENLKQHQAQELLEGKSWVDLLKDRDFKDGNWHTIVVGILYQLALDERFKTRCNRLLQALVPLDDEVSPETVTAAFKTLDVNDRIEILDILVKLTISTKTVRKHLEDMSAEMTKLRKNKVDHQSIRKKAIRELHRLDDERKPLVIAAQGTEAAAEVSEIQIEVKEDAPTNGAADSDNDSEDAARTIRRGGERAIDRKRKREEEAERKRKAKKPAIAKLTKEEMALKKINDVIEKTKEEIREAEDAIADCNNDLRETDCQRTKCLGRDRFCNRYYWFERNGMPFGGLPNTSTAEYGYANGRLWIQGPDEMEREGFIELPQQEQQLYKDLHGMTVIDRKKEEEGPTHLNNATEWAYIDTPEALDQLIHWLDERGNREKPLRKELQLWRDVMVECMTKMHAHLDEVEAKKKGSTNGDGALDSGTRVSTRTKTYVDLDSTQWTCLKWENTQAREHCHGRIHSEGSAKSAAKSKKGMAKKIPLGKDGKVVTKGKGKR